MTRRQARGVALASGLLVLLALVVWLVPVSVPSLVVEEEVADPPAVAADGPRAVVDVERYAGIVQGNLFSPDRTPPPLASEEPEPLPVVVAPQPQLPQYRLSGIVQGPDGYVALIDADRTFPGAELYQVGDSVGPFVLEQVTDSLVVLRSGPTTRTLRLDTISGRSR